MNIATKIARIPPSILEEQWYSLLHKLIEKMQIAYRNAQNDDVPLNQKMIAARLGRKPSFVSRCLSGQQNMTIRTIHDLARGMDCRLEVSFQPLKLLPRSNYSLSIRPDDQDVSDLEDGVAISEPNKQVFNFKEPEHVRI
jgi:hypothetical protein